MKTIKPIVFIIAFFNFSHVLFSQENSILWKIEGNGLANPSYLFGTIHAIPKENYFFPDYMKKAFKSTETLIMEIDMNISISDKLKLASDMLLPDNTTLKNYTDSATYSFLCNYLKDSLKMSQNKINRIVRIKPIFISSLIIQEKINNIKTCEDELSKLAKKYRKSIIGLETVWQQLQIIDSVPIHDMIPDSNSLYNIFNDFHKMVDVYNKQDIYHLYEIMQKDSDFISFEDKILITRNHKWIPIIEENIQRKSAFIAVGCGHLPGQNGLIEMLRKKGYTVTPVVN